MEGTGAISHMSVKNKPDIFNEPGTFAGISIKGVQNGARSLKDLFPTGRNLVQRIQETDQQVRLPVAPFSECLIQL
jgi:hypothetical protein